MRSLRRLSPYLRPYIPHIVGSLLLAILLAGLRSAPVKLVEKLVDDLMVARDPGKLHQFPLIFIALYLANFLVRFPHYYLMRIIVARVNQKLKNDLFDRVMGLSADYFTQQSVGSLMSRVNADPQYVDGGIAAAHTAIREPIYFIGLFTWCLLLNWKLTLITLLVLPPLAWVFSATGRNLRRYIQQLNQENAHLFSALQESFTGARIVKTFNLENYVREKFRNRSERYAKILLKTAVLEETSHPMVEFITAFLIAGVIYFGGRQVVQGEMTPGELMAFFTAFAMMLHPLRLMNDISLKLHGADSAATRIFEVMDWKSNLVETAQPRKLERFDRSIELKEVRFSYPDAPEREILKGISLEVRKGEAVALVGQSGAGKSSLVSLLPRLFDVTQGSIRIDGIDLRELSLESLRSKIAVVSQDVFLFNDTIEENIRCGRLGASHEDILTAARRAHALEFIDRLPQGFQTVIGDRGMKLSGGERQRLSIARAFLREAPILLLDEATSSLDTASERAVQEALDELMKDRTTLVIAHRLSTVRNLDRIYVLKDGRVVESGRHDELLSHQGEYARFYRLSQATPS
jgi:subfamily B ATP-binding cassette protein MsbA